MTGRAEPSFAELRENLVRRLESLEIPGLRASKFRRNRRRGNQKRIPDDDGFFARQAESSAAATATNQTAVTKANPPTSEDSVGIDIEFVHSSS
jgi:hypothetical protein